MQTFRDFEVIVTDDSPDLAVKTLCAAYGGRFTLRYFRNEKQLGTPENWNEAIRMAEGRWIKIMHDDDWFAGGDSLDLYARTIREQPEAAFIFAAYRDIFLDKYRSRDMYLSSFWYRALVRNKTILFSRNVIGPPSVVLYKKESSPEYDPRVKWVVDIDFYIRYLEGKKPVYINKILVNVGLGKDQVTQDCFRQRPIEIPENFYLLNKAGAGNLRNILVYDAWWRLMRNLEIARVEDIKEAGYGGEIPAVILSMVAWQNKMPGSLLRIGIYSKTCMFLHYILHYNRIPA
jgi:glycosyltransferase involved in cell wall biosynthesis